MCKFLGQVIGFERDEVGVQVFGIEGVGSMVEHDLSKTMGGTCRLDTQVAEHSIRAPASQKAGDGGVNVPTEEGCSTPRAERLGRYL